MNEAKFKAKRVWKTALNARWRYAFHGILFLMSTIWHILPNGAPISRTRITEVWILKETQHVMCTWLRSAHELRLQCVLNTLWLRLLTLRYKYFITANINMIELCTGLRHATVIQALIWLSILTTNGNTGIEGFDIWWERLWAGWPPQKSYFWIQVTKHLN